MKDGRKKLKKEDLSKTQDFTVLKKRPENTVKGGRLFARTLVYALIIIVISLALSVFLLSVANDALGFLKPSAEIEVEIPAGASTSEIAEKLVSAGAIEYPFAFRIFTKLTGNDGKFKYGKYELNTEMDYLEIVTALKKTSIFREEITVMIPEGLELREIFKRLQTAGVCTSEALYKCMETYDFNYDFLDNLPERENILEGYLFPDTYNFFTNESPEVVIKKLLDNFNIRFNAELRARADELGMTMDEVVILASIIEREAASDLDRTTVASVFVNRLNSTSYPRLQSCATVQYVLEERKPVLSTADTKIDSPYNTYMYDGLPIGPIASPGLASIIAALYPEDTDYYYFVVDASGKHIFSKTLAEHNEAVKKAASSRGTAVVGG